MYTHLSLSESSSDTTIADEKAALGDAYQPNALAARSHKFRTRILVGLIILNTILFIGLASLFTRLRNRVEWKGAPQVWSTSNLCTHV